MSLEDIEIEAKYGNLFEAQRRLNAYNAGLRSKRAKESSLTVLALSVVLGLLKLMKKRLLQTAGIAVALLSQINWRNPKRRR